MVVRAVVPVLLLLLAPLPAQSFSTSIACPRSLNVGDVLSITLTVNNSGGSGQDIRVITTMVGQGVVETFEDVAVLGPIVATEIRVRADSVLEEAFNVPTAIPASFAGKAFSQIVISDGPDSSEVDDCLIAVPEPEHHWQMLALLLAVGLLGQRARSRSNPRNQSLEAF